MIVLASLVGGVALFTWISLRAVRAHRAGATSIVFVIALAILIPVVAGVGSTLLPVNIGIVPLGAIATGVLACGVAAVVSRYLVWILDRVRAESGRS